MKNLFSLLVMVLFGSAALAQNSPAISACNDPEGGVQLFFDVSQNCPTAPAGLAGLDSIGFHSGGSTDAGSGWAGVVGFDAATATAGVKISTDTFRVYIAEPDAYYGLTGVVRMDFVFNQGITNPGAPWDAEGKADDGAGGCMDFNILVADITETCRTSVVTSINKAQLDLGLTVAPNPMSDRTLLRFRNPAREALDVTVMSLDGRVVRRYADVRTESLTIERDHLPTGLYFVHFVNEKGQHTATSLMME